MISTFISILLTGLVLYLIYFVARMFVKGQPLKIVCMILALVFVIYVLRVAGIVPI